MSRLTHCRRCGAPITQPATGRPRLFCSTACRRYWNELMSPLRDVRPPLDEPSPFHSREADRQLRALYAELRSTSRACFELAGTMELAGDPLESARLASVGGALECLLEDRFADLAEKS